jgi:hypothetical protein
VSCACSSTCTHAASSAARPHMPFHRLRWRPATQPLTSADRVAAARSPVSSIYYSQLALHWLPREPTQQRPAPACLTRPPHSPFFFHRTYVVDRLASPAPYIYTDQPLHRSTLIFHLQHVRSTHLQLPPRVRVRVNPRPKSRPTPPRHHHYLQGSPHRSAAASHGRRRLRSSS